MSELSNLKPGETLVLIDGGKAEFKSLLKFTFMDLLLKQVLEVKESSRSIRHGKGYRNIKTKYVVTGKNFAKYKPDQYEAIFLNVFYKSPDLKAILTKLIKVAYDAVPTEIKYRKKIILSFGIKSVFKTSLLFNLFGFISLTSRGTTLKESIFNELNSIDATIADKINNAPKEALEILTKIGGNIFLLNNVDFALLKQIDHSIYASMQIDQRFNDSYDNYWYHDFSDLFIDDSSFDTWDSTFDSFDSGFDSAGCSSFDSGCSSCGGCGGCD